jgi:ribose 5-phosphate isomerase B
MKIAMGSDHAGYELKEAIKNDLTKKGYTVKDFGTYSPESVDYPDYGIKASEAVARGECQFGIVICGSGIGISIAANKVKGIRAALVCDIERASLARMHNNANIVALGSRFMSFDIAKEVVTTFLNTPFEGQRHEKRVKKIDKYEEDN